jgi:hypothetical protein
MTSKSFFCRVCKKESEPSTIYFLCVNCWKEEREKSKKRMFEFERKKAYMNGKGAEWEQANEIAEQMKKGLKDENKVP